MNEPAILRQREVEELLCDHFRLRYRESRTIVAADVIPRTMIDGCTQRRWLRVDVLQFDVAAYLRNTAGRQGHHSTGPRESAATSATCP